MGTFEVMRENDSAAIVRALASRAIAGLVLDLDFGLGPVTEIVVQLRRGGGQNARTRVVAMTGGATRSALAAAIAAGVDKVVTKPISGRTLAMALTTPSTRQKEPPNSAGREAASSASVTVEL
jgi:DNA-binding response OmpR family regulator